MMRQQYHVSGKYIARYPSGHYTGEIGISANIRAKNKRAARKAVRRKAIATHGYIQFNWVDVIAQPARPDA